MWPSSNKQAEKKPKKKKKKKNSEEKESSAAVATSASVSASPMAAGGGSKGADLVVHVEGMDVTPLKTFDAAKMPPEVMTYVTKRGWTQPTQIQAHCWPVLNAGRDVVGIAETGSGKTLAFSLPAMSKIFKAKKNKVCECVCVRACVMETESRRSMPCFPFFLQHQQKKLW